MWTTGALIHTRSNSNSKSIFKKNFHKNVPFLGIQSLAAKICPPMSILSPFELEFSPLVANVQDATLWCAPARVLLRDNFLGSPSLPRWRLPSQQSLSKPRFRPEYKTQLLHEITVEAKTLRLSVGNRQLHVRPFVHCCSLFGENCTDLPSSAVFLVTEPQLLKVQGWSWWSTASWMSYCVIGTELGVVLW